MNVKGVADETIKTEVLGYSRCGKLKNPLCSMTAELSISLTLKPFTSNGDVFTSEKTFNDKK